MRGLARKAQVTQWCQGIPGRMRTPEENVKKKLHV